MSKDCLKVTFWGFTVAKQPTSLWGNPRVVEGKLLQADRVERKVYIS